MPQVEMFYFVLISLWMSVLGLEPASKVVADRYAVYWNRTNARWVSYLRIWYTKTPFHFCHSEAPQSAEYRAKYNAAANWTGSSSRQDRLNKFHWWYNSHKLHCKGETSNKMRDRLSTALFYSKLYGKTIWRYDKKRRSELRKLKKIEARIVIKYVACLL